ncbi:MAG: hypothetical protein LBQ21_00940 [Clostridiales Family XIII bacterium]|nr:hypothetical protein [Clostridiales Family XIII bacterium]
MSDNDFEKIKRQYREAIFAADVSPDAENRATDEDEKSYVDADGKIKLSDIEEYVNSIVEKKLSALLREQNIPLGSGADVPLETSESKKPQAPPASFGIDSIFKQVAGSPAFVHPFALPAAEQINSAETVETAAEPLPAPTPRTEAPTATPFSMDSIFGQAAGADGFAQPFTIPAPEATAPVPTTEPTAPIATPEAAAEPLPAPAPRTEAPAAKSTNAAPFATPFDALASVAAPFETATPATAKESVVTPKPAAVTEPVSAKEPAVTPKLAAPKESTTEAESAPNVQLKSADEDFLQETAQTFGRRAKGGSIAFDTNRPQVKEITDKFKPIEKEVTARQSNAQAFEEKFERIPTHTEGKSADIEIEERLSRVFKPTSVPVEAPEKKPAEPVAKKIETPAPAPAPTPTRESADTALEARITKIFGPAITKGTNEDDASFEERIHQMFGPVEDASAKPSTTKASKSRVKQSKQTKAEKKKKDDVPKRKRKGFGSPRPIIVGEDSDDSVSSTMATVGGDKRIALLVAILLAGSIALGTLGNLGILNLTAYSEWIRGIFGNIFGG